MANLSSRKLLRLVGRGINIAKRTTNKTLQIASAPLTASKDKHTAARKKLRSLRKKYTKELTERDQAVAEMAKKYDSTRSVALMNSPRAEVGERASDYTTPDDKIQAAEDLEEWLLDEAGVDTDHPVGGEGDAAPTGAGWALALLGDLSPLVIKAIKENTEAMQATEDLHDAVTALAEAKGGLDYQIRTFRQVIRDELGVSSKEYAALRLRTRSSSSDEEEGSDFDDPELAKENLDDLDAEEPETPEEEPEEPTVPTRVEPTPT